MIINSDSFLDTIYDQPMHIVSSIVCVCEGMCKNVDAGIV